MKLKPTILPYCKSFQLQKQTYIICGKQHPHIALIGYEYYMYNICNWEITSQPRIYIHDEITA
jgi:hypothetical protein